MDVPVSGKVIKPVDNQLIMDLFTSGADLTYGKYNEMFESRFARRIGIEHAFFVNSGSSANLLAFAAFASHNMYDHWRIKPGDEIITVAASFPTTITPILQYGCIPVFVDVDETMNIDITKLEEAVSNKTRGVFIAHTLGNPFNVAAIKEFCDVYGLFLIEDSCDALGSTYWEKQCGSFGTVSTFSFYPAHHMSCAFNTRIPYKNEGGNIVFDTIENIYRKYGEFSPPIKVLSFNAHNKIEWIAPTHIIRHTLTKKMRRLTLQHGRSVDITDDHSVFVLDESLNIISKQAGEITHNDFVVVGAKLPSEHSPKEFNLIEEAKKEQGLRFHVSGNLDSYLNDIQNRDEAWQCRNRDSMPLKYVTDSGKCSHIGISRTNTKIPSKLNINNNVSRLIGYFMAEGSYRANHGINISLHKDEIDIISDIETIMHCEFGLDISINTCKNSKGINVYISSATLTWVFKNVFGIQSGAKCKRIPSFLFSCSPDIIKSFIYGYTKGDGSEKKEEFNHNTIDVSSVNVSLLEDYQFLLSLIGISGSFYRRNKATPRTICGKSVKIPNENFTVRIAGYIYDDILRTIIPSNLAHKNEFVSQIPITPTVRKWLDNTPAKNNKTISKNRLLEILKSRGMPIPTALAGDLAFFKVRENIEIEYNNQYVYDFSTPPYQNFYGGFMGMFLHNTTFEGGMVCTNFDTIAHIIRSLRGWGKGCACRPGQDNVCGRRYIGKYGDLPEGYDHKYVFEELGYNLQATQVQAAMGYSQLQHIDEFTERRHTNWKYLYDELIPYAEHRFTVPKIQPDSDPSWFGFPIILNPNWYDRREITEKLTRKGVQNRLLFAGNITKQPMFTKGKYPYRVVGDLMNTDDIMNNMFWVGSWHGLSDDQMKYSAETIREVLL